MSQIIIVEGCDFTGKTSLIGPLAKDLGAITVKASIPTNRQEVYDWVDFIKSWKNGPIICDRSPLISDPIYSKVLNRQAVVNSEMSQVLLKSLNPIVVICDPGLEQVLKCNNQQMTGVKENLREIHFQYRKWVSELQPVRIIMYDFLRGPEGYTVLKEYLTEGFRRIPDLEAHMVDLFHLKFGIPSYPKSWDDSVADFRVKFLREEVEEFREALSAGDKVKAFDALLDLVYVAKGSALMMGISSHQWAKGFTAVQRANMAKERVASADQSKRGHAFDVKKPLGWVGPELELRKILGIPE